MSFRFRRLIQKYSPDKGLTAQVLDIIPERFRNRTKTLKHFDGDEEQVEWVEAILLKFAGTGTVTKTHWRKVREVFLVIENLPNVSTQNARRLAEQMKTWSKRDLDSLVRIKNSFGNETESLEFFQWFFRNQAEEGLLDFVNLRKRFTPFKRIPPNPVELRNFRENFDATMNWNFREVPLREGNYSYTYTSTDDFGRVWESRTFEELPSAPGIRKAEDLNETVPNFPVIDARITRTNGRREFGQITHGKLESLKEKFEKLLDIKSYSDAHDTFERMITHLQDLNLWQGRMDFRQRARLYVQEDAVGPLRAFLASHSSFPDWRNRSGLSGERLLEVIQPIPNIPP